MLQRSYKNKEFISSLSNQELRDYYSCLSHHHTNRNVCKTGQVSELNTTGCPCTCQSTTESNHFCTSFSLPPSDKCLTHSNETLNSTLGCQLNNSNSIIVCENYAPSFTSKSDQIQTLKKEIGLMKKSKSTLKKAMQDLDKLFDDNFVEPGVQDDGLNEVERFYRSDKFIGSSMNIRSLNKYLPRTDIKYQPHKFEMSNVKTQPEFGTSIFSLGNRDLFVDRDILANNKIKKTPTKPDFKIRTKSAVIYSK